MPSVNDVPHEGTQPVSPYKGLFAVDAEKFSSNADVYLANYAYDIEETLVESFSSAGLPDLWQSREFAQHTGDGYVFGFDPLYLTQIIDPLIAVMQVKLFSRHRSAKRDTPRIRLRAAIHVGPVPASGDVRRDGIATSRVDVHRLLDSVQIRRALLVSNPDVTFVSAIISQRVFEDVITSKRCGIDGSEMVKVTATVPAKPFSMAAYVYTPRPSGDLLNPSAIATPPQPSTAEPKNLESPSSAIQPGMTNTGQAIGQVLGDANFNPIPKK